MTKAQAIAFIYSLPLFVLILGCGGSSMDIHDVDRETKPYETVSADSMDADALLDHLDLLANEMSLATQSEAYVEMHYIEIALTQALVSLESQSPTEAKPIIDTLKIIAAKIHGAGHDQNKTMSTKLDATLSEQIARLKSAIGSTAL